MQNSKASVYAFFVAIGGFLFGFDASVISGVVRFVTIEWNLTPWQVGMVVAAPTFVAIPSALLGGVISDKIGRRTTLIILAITYIVSAVCSAFAPDFWTLVMARALGGFAFASLGIAPVYIAEISPPEKRGFMVSFNQMNIVIGFAVSYFSNYFLLNLSQSGGELVAALHIDTHVWRWMLGLELLPAMLFMMGALIVPESPRWLVRAGREQEAKEVMGRLMPTSEIEPTVVQIKSTLAEYKPSIREQLPDLLSPRLRLPMMIGLIVGIAQQITGINAIYFYAPSIFEQTGVGTNAAFFQTALLGTTNVICTIIAMLCIDRLGRKPLLLIGLVGVFMTMMAASYGFKTASYELPSTSISEFSKEIQTEVDFSELTDRKFNSDISFKRAARAAIGENAYRKHESEILRAATNINATLIMVAIIAFTASFAISLGPVMWVLFSEIFPNRSRGLFGGVAGFFNATTAYLVTQIFPWELDTIGASNTFMIFGVFSAISFILIYWLLPETKGRSMEELEQEWASWGEKRVKSRTQSDDK
ncbi:MAG: sugar porter family MFS transporter [Pseudomonadota bacterium]